MRNIITGSALCLALFVSPLAAQAEVATAPQDSLRAKILEVAERYANFEWKAEKRNVLHGDDGSGVHVDTPDTSFHEDGFRTDGSANRGMPYSWGGFTSIEQFERGLKLGLFAGNVPKSERAGASARAMGLDCSGFVARAWDLPTKQSTRSLGSLCYPLASCEELMPGDVLNKFDSHVVLFKEWANDDHTQMRVIEAARLRVKESVYPVQATLDAGFVPMRYKPLDERWAPMQCDEPYFSAGDNEGNFVAFSTGSVPTLDSLANPLANAKPGEWIRYAVSDPYYTAYAGLGTTVSRTTMVAQADDGGVERQTVIDIGGSELMTGASCDATASFTDSIIEFLEPLEPLHDMKPVESAISVGKYDVGDHSYGSRQIHVRLEGSTVVRHKSFPVSIEISCVQTGAVPLHGILEGTFTTETTWATDKEGNPTRVSKRVQRFELDSYGGVHAKQ